MKTSPTIRLLGVLLLPSERRVNGFTTTTPEIGRVSFFRLHGKEPPAFLSVSPTATSSDLTKKERKKGNKSINTRRDAAGEQPTFQISNEDPNDQRYSAQDWLHNMHTLPRSTVLRAVKGPVIAAMIWSLCVTLVIRTMSPHYCSFLVMPSTIPHAATVSALALLLVFRTNSAYQRFNECRLIWERILGVARNFTRLLYLYPDEFSVARRKRMCRWIAAFPYLLHNHVQDVSPTHITSRNPSLSRLFGSSAKTTHPRRSTMIPWGLLPTACAAASHRPMWLCDALAREIAAVPYSDMYTSRERERLLGYVGQLSAASDQCERIHQTVVPVNYARHCVRALTLWLWTLPMVLLQQSTSVLWVVPTVGMVAWLLFGIYQIGYTIEDPFRGSLRLAALCDEIYRNILATNRSSAFDV